MTWPMFIWPMVISIVALTAYLIGLYVTEKR
jgi:hypothetical protein